MPFVTIHTSAELPTEEKQTTLLRALSSTVAKLTGKPESYVMTSLAPRARMTFAGSVDPACFVEVRSIGGLSGDIPTKLTKAICERVHDTLGVATNRVYVVFQDVPPALWGFDGATFG